jgi:PAS domain S-box-containing protein
MLQLPFTPVDGVIDLYCRRRERSEHQERSVYFFLDLFTVLVPTRGIAILMYYVYIPVYVLRLPCTRTALGQYGDTPFKFSRKNSGMAVMPETVSRCMHKDSLEDQLQRLLLENERLRALEKSSQQLAMVVEASQVGSWDWNLSTGVVAVNRQWATIIGYSIEELAPITIDTWISFCHPEDLMQSNMLLKQHFNGETEYYDIEVRMRHKRGNWIWVHDRGKVFEWDSDGNPLRMVGSHQDITLRKCAEEKIVREKNLFIGGPVTVFRWKNDPGWPVEYVSANVWKLLGYSAEELTCGIRNYETIIHEEDRAFFHEDLSGDSFEREYRLIRKDGSVIWVYDFTVVVRDDHKNIICFDGYIIDNTERKKAEQVVVYSMEFERLVTDLSNQFITMPYDAIDSMVNNTLLRIGEFVRADRSYIFLFRDDHLLMDNTHEWCREGIEPQIELLKGIPTDLFPWWMERVHHNEVIHLPRVADMPKVASAEKEILESQDIQSLIVIPLTTGSKPFGYIGFDAVSHERDWKPETIAILKLAGGIIANALQRKHIEHFIQAELQLAIKLSGSASFKETLDYCLQAAMDVSDMDCGGIYLVDRSVESVTLACYRGLPESFVENVSTFSFDSPEGRVVLAGKPLYRHFREIGLTTNPVIIGENLQCIAVLPITFRGEVIACLNIASHSAQELFEFERKGLETVTSHIGAAIIQSHHEKETLEAKKNLESLFDTIDDFLFIVDMSGAVIHSNATVKERLGYSLAELSGKQVLQFHPEKQWEEAKANIEGMIAGSRTCCRVPLLTKSGAMIPVETKITRGVWNNTPVLFGVSRDITERVGAEQALRETEHRFRELTEMLPLPLFETDIQGFITYTNRKGYEDFGYNKDDLKRGLSIFSCCIPEESERISKNLLTLWEGKHLTAVYTACRKDKSRFVAQIYSLPIMRKGQIIGARGVVVDLTELKKAEDALREISMQKRMFKELKTLIDNIPGAVYRVKANGKATMLSVPNDFQEEFTRDEFEKELFETQALIHPEDRERIALSNQSLRLTRQSESLIYRIVAENGSFRWVEDRKTSAFSPEGLFTGIDGILFDITDRIMAEENKQLLESQLRKAQRLETIGTLAGGIAHDFNNILTPIIGYAELGLIRLSGLRREDLLNDYFTQIIHASERAQDLVDQILTFSKSRESSSSMVSMQAIIAEALKLLRPLIPSTITIEQDIENSCPDILADSSQIHQVIINLCTNAFHAMENSGGVLTIGLREVMPDKILFAEFPKMDRKSYLRLCISDTGKGMDDETRERIFEPFYTTKAVNKGTGLGLSVVHGIITGYNGVITVKSSPEKGTSFFVYLPVMHELLDPLPVAEMPLARSFSVLVVDDELPSLQAITLMVIHLGLRVQALSVPQQALELFRANPGEFDLVIADFTMSEMSGVALAGLLHEINPRLPIIFMTADKKNIKTIMPQSLCGISKILEKPVKQEELASTINDVLSSNNL